MTAETTIMLGVACLLFRATVKDASRLVARILKRRARRVRDEARRVRAEALAARMARRSPERPRQPAPPPDSTDAFYVPPGRNE